MAALFDIFAFFKDLCFIISFIKSFKIKGLWCPQITFVLRGTDLYHVFPQKMFSHLVYLIAVDSFQRLLRMSQFQITCFFYIAIYLVTVL